MKFELVGCLKLLFFDFYGIEVTFGITVLVLGLPISAREFLLSSSVLRFRSIEALKLEGFTRIES